MPRTLLIAANWKMNSIPKGALEENSPYRERADIDVVVFPTFVDMPACIGERLLTGAQYGHPEASGAHTGDVSMRMIADHGARYVLCGHSERRKDHRETNEDVATQAIAALEANLHPIVCVGETEEERDAGEEKKIVREQMKALPSESKIILAYEPVWAIGTGKTATPEQAQEMHAHIRSLLPEDMRAITRILYGGSMKPENAEDLLKQPDIDGGLIGGASLQPDAFGKIIAIAAQLASLRESS